jgi:murein DD-endopeptidase MepM/ murein hydrolase activator NlpD
VYGFGWIFKGDKKARRRWLILSGFFLTLLFFSLYFLFSRPTANLEQPETQILLTEGTIKGKSTLYQSLLEKNIPIRWIHLIISELKPYVDFNRIKGGTYRFFTDAKGELVKFIFEKSPLEVYKLEKGPQGYVAQRDEVSLGKHLVKVEGEIRSSLYEALNAAGEKDSLALSFAEILAWEIDFYQDLREGDRFKMMVEKIYKRDQFIQYGTIYGVEYEQEGKIIRGIRYRDDYYSEEGISLRKAFLKAPLRFDRISSRFSGARRHPILGGVRPHYGVDYAAPAGTPVWAVADGTVLSVGWNGGFGKQVIVRHMNGYRSYYGHLSRYGPGIRKGMRVTQKQIIGYVGSTGLSTGPHLDYRLSKDSRFRNPLKEVFPAGSPLRKEEREEFYKKRDEVLSWLADDVPVQRKVEEVTSDILQ